MKDPESPTLDFLSRISTWWNSLDEKERWTNVRWIFGSILLPILICAITLWVTSREDAPGVQNLDPTIYGGESEEVTQSSPTAPTLTHTPSAIPTLTSTLKPSPTSTSASTPTPTNTATIAETPTASCDWGDITISEIAIAPPYDPIEEGTLGVSRNEYVELYNHGDETIDVRGFWISDSGVQGEPDDIVAWDDRYPAIPVSSFPGVITDSTEIPPGSYALVLAPDYRWGEMPYVNEIEAGAIVLTLADNGAEIQVIGKDGLSGTGEHIDTLVLYQGTSEIIDFCFSTYGTPDYSESPSSIRDNGKDQLPFDLRYVTDDETYLYVGVRKKNLDEGDYGGNWERISLSDITPGRGVASGD
jgi:hypothetical protein